MMAKEASSDGAAGRAASAAEPGRAPRPHEEHAGACLNCGAQLTGRYCAECGQAAHLHKTVGAIWHELVHGVLHLDGKLFRTLPELALRPGALTRRYIDGERAKFVSPLGLFLFSALLLYASYSVFGGAGEAASRVSAQEAAEELREEADKTEKRILDAERELKEPELTAGRRARLQQRLVEARETRDELVRATSSATAAAAQKGGPVGGLSTLERMRADREFVSYRLKANAYKFSWALIIISTPMVWLLFAWNRRFGLYDHAVFVTYSIAFMSLLFSAWTIVSGLGLGHGVLLLGLMLYGLWHLYAQLKGTYRLAKLNAVFRFALLCSIAAVSGGMFYAVITMMS
jgi:hypothetical protein